jgi:hypothetical protein
MKKTLAFIAIAAILAACSKEEAKPSPAATTATQPSAAGPTSTVSTNAAGSIPKECQDYLDRVNACASKQGGAAGDAIKAGMEQTKAAWSNLSGNQAALGGACKAATDAFAAQASAMKC